MSSRLQSIADGVATALAAGTFSHALTVERVYDVQVDADALPAAATGVMVTVLAKESPASRATRGELLEEYVIDVAVRTRVSDKSAATCDPLSALVESIRDHFWVETWPEAPESLSLKDAAMVPWSEPHMRESGVFFALVTLTFEDIIPLPARGTP
jgi:hypothetical protein